jgi:hypothetical protein
MGNNSIKKVRDIIKGDEIMGINGIHIVKCVVETKVFAET